MTPDPLTSAPSLIHRHPAARAALLTLGWIALALALCAAIAPLIPIWPFLLGAVYCFERSSTRFHNALINNRWLGPHIRRFQTTHGLAPHVKWTMILTTVLITAGYDCFLDNWIIVKSVTTIIALLLVAYVWRLPAISSPDS